MDNIKISVIVPAYNVEKYVEECLDSIINQTYTNLEIIIVDDGATDSTPQIVDRYAEKDNRIKVIHKPNGGLSSARNAGMKIMTGDYVSFIDSDDSIEHDTYEKVVEVIKKDKDVDFVSFFCKDTSSAQWRNSGKSECKDAKNILKDFIRGEGLVNYSVWDKVYSSRLLENSIFSEGKYFEDAPFVLEILLKAKKVYILFRELYNYRRDNANSISHLPSLKILDAYYIFEELKEKCKGNQLFCNYIDMTIITHAKSNIFGCGQSSRIKDDKEKKKLIKELCKVVKAKRNAPILIDSLKERLKLKSFVLFPELYAFVYRHKKYERFKAYEE